MGKKETTRRPARGYGTPEHARGTMGTGEGAASLPDLIRIVAWRRWHFLIAMAIGTVLAMISSLFWPRQYTARCVIERQDDLSLSSIVSANSPFGFQTYRLGLPVELQGLDAVKAAIEAVGMSRGLPRDVHGALTLEGQQRLQLMAEGIGKRIEPVFLQKSERLDLIEVSFRWSDPKEAQQLLTKLKDNYIERTRGLIVDNMKKARDFFDGEEKRYAKLLADAEQDLDKIKMDAGGDPSKPGFIEGELTKLEADKNLLLQKKREHDRALKSAEKSLASLNQQITSVATRPSASAPAPTTSPADAYALIAQIEKEIRDLEDAIENNRVLRQMTPQHPDMVALHAKLDRKRAHLDRARHGAPTATAPASNLPLDLPALLLERQKTEQYIALVRELIADVVDDIAGVEARIAAWQSKKPDLLEAQQKYRIRLKEYEQARAEHGRWRDWRDQVQRFLSAEVSQRGIQLSTKEEAQPVLKASSPTFAWVLIVSLGFGTAVGAGVVVLTEFFDRSFRTALQVSRSLGLPILESIDEILTPPVKLRRFIRRAIVLPSILTVLLVMLTGAGVVAYVSLEQPDRYQRWKGSPFSVVEDGIEILRRP